MKHKGPQGFEDEQLAVVAFAAEMFVKAYDGCDDMSRISRAMDVCLDAGELFAKKCKQREANRLELFRAMEREQHVQDVKRGFDNGSPPLVCQRALVALGYSDDEATRRVNRWQTDRAMEYTKKD